MKSNAVKTSCDGGEKKKGTLRPLLVHTRGRRVINSHSKGKNFLGGRNWTNIFETSQNKGRVTPKKEGKKGQKKRKRDA